MDTAKVMEFIPAIIILGSVMAIIIIIILKYGNIIFDRNYKSGNILLIVIASLFIMILIVHLFKEQTWTADTLKILVGALIGASSTKISRKKSKGDSSVDNNGIIQGDVAGRDINKNIQNIEKAVSDIKDSVVHQNNKIEQIIDNNPDKDYLINTIYERGSRVANGISKVIRFWRSEGWTLKHFCSDYQGMDGLFLIFEKPKQSDEIQIYYYNGSDSKIIKEIL
ncbi:MAG: hypothetical protein FWD40_01145 [Treponema sp.]|nr:hypothetical protein [Treponema sp.]